MNVICPRFPDPVVADHVYEMLYDDLESVHYAQLRNRPEQVLNYSVSNELELSPLQQ